MCRLISAFTLFTSASRAKFKNLSNSCNYPMPPLLRVYCSIRSKLLVSSVYSMPSGTRTDKLRKDFAKIVIIIARLVLHNWKMCFCRAKTWIHSFYRSVAGSSLVAYSNSVEPFSMCQARQWAVRFVSVFVPSKMEAFSAVKWKWHVHAIMSFSQWCVQHHSWTSTMLMKH